MVVIRPPVWISILFTFIGTTNGVILNTTACFIGDICNHYNLTCPQSHMIRVMEAEYRYKSKGNCRTESCNSTESCCYFDESDCKTTYSPLHALTVYNKCSGNQTCVSNRAAQGNIYNCNNNANDSLRYIHVKYSCIPATEVIDMCYSPTKRNFSKVNIMLLNKSQSTNVTSECKCFVESQDNVSYQLVDIRFFTVTEGSENYTCTSGNLRINGLFIQCSSNNRSFIYQGSDQYDGQLHGNREIILNYSQTYTPTMVWIYINGSRTNFTIHCVNTTSTEADINNGTSTTTRQTGTSENTSSTILTSTASLSTGRVTSSDKQSSTALTSTSLNGEEGQSKHLIIILVVVATVLVITAILVAVFILHRRRCKKPTGDDASKDELPNELINHDSASNRQSHLNYETVETSNYDEMNDESIATYAIPARKEKDDSAIAKDEKKNGGNCTIDEYDRIEFEKTCAVKKPNYDSVSVIEVKKVDDTYSHASSRSQPATAPTANEYSHGQFVRNDSQSNDYTSKTTIVNEPRVADNYSHVDLDSDRTKRKPSNIVDEDSYHHIDLNKTTFASRNGEAVSVRTIHEFEEGSQTFKEDLQSLDVESEVWPIDNGNSRVSSQDQPLQDIMAVSLPDKYIEFKIGDIYDTPVRKDQQYTVVLKGNNEHLFNSIDARSKRKSETEESNGASKDFANGSDYELVKPTDV